MSDSLSSSEKQVRSAELEDPDAQYGGHEARVALEKKLVRKVDLRMSVLVFIYVLNYVRSTIFFTSRRIVHQSFVRLIATMLREFHSQTSQHHPTEYTQCDSAARLRGFESDLHLKGQEFATLLSILYVGYIIMQIPS